MESIQIVISGWRPPWPTPAPELEPTKPPKPLTRSRAHDVRWCTGCGWPSGLSMPHGDGVCALNKNGYCQWCCGPYGPPEKRQAALAGIKNGHKLHRSDIEENVGLFYRTGVILGVR